jgi:iron-sulfur cluster repair protein YtfE (RIC family)
MTDISSYLTDDHRHCDEAFLAAERAIVDRRWAEAEHSLADFAVAMARHFASEEDLLFPAFEAASGSTAGPTMVMRMEHEQINGLLEALHRAVTARDREDCLGLFETLLLLMQQHNAKEENILYPVADRLLESDAAGLVERMRGI